VPVALHALRNQNMNSITIGGDQYEARRQIEITRRWRGIDQETRLFDPSKGRRARCV
jgi:Asp-tRNA(Asn)/Glu-tRNA(Gln) amidotransferase B subunit